MANLNEISLKARSKSHDFIWFTSKPNSFKWFGKYKTFFNESEDLLNCTVEIDSDSYKLYFGKIYSQKSDHQGRRTYYTLQVNNGSRGSLSSQYLYKLICVYLSDLYSSIQASVENYHKYTKVSVESDSSVDSKKAIAERDAIKEKISVSQISTLFDKEFTEEYVSSIFPDKEALSIEVESEIQEKIQKIIDELPFECDSMPEENEVKDVLIFDSIQSKINLFLTELIKIKNNESIDKKIVLVLTNRPLESSDMQNWDANEYSRVICLTSNVAQSDELPLKPKAKNIDTPKHSEKKSSIDDFLKDLDDSSKKAEDGKTYQHNLVQEPMLEKKSKGCLIVFLIIFLIIFVVLFRSCGKNSPEPQNPQPQTEQTQK